jgi:hypothetical protein
MVVKKGKKVDKDNPLVQKVTPQLSTAKTNVNLT